MKNNRQEALERIGAIFVTFTCNDDGDKDYCHLRDNNDYEEDYKVLQEAVVKANKYDELMKPKKVHTQCEWDGEGYSDYHHCPKCGCPVTGRYPIFTNDKFCTNCGCPLDWEEEKK